MKKPTKTPKPTAPIAGMLKVLWTGWILYRLIVYTGVMSLLGGVFLYGLMWQLLVLLPALLFTKAVYQGRSAYALLWASMVMLVYLGVVGVFLLMRFYENHHAGVVWVLSFEWLMLLGINVLLFVLLKRLPPMHKEYAHE